MLKKNTFLEENIEVSEKVHEDLFIEKLEIKIVEDINEYPIIEKYLEVKMEETIEGEIEEEIFKDLNEIKSYDCQSQDPFILVVSDAPKYIDFIGIDRF